MKISAKTLNAATKAAEARGMSLDKWAEQVLAEAAAGSGKPLNIEAQLREISKKIDLLADRQSLGEKANEQLASAVQELGASYSRARKSAEQAISVAEASASSTAEDLTEKASEFLEKLRKSASDFLGPVSLRSEDKRESTAKPKKFSPSGKPKRSRASKRTRSVGTTRRRTASSKKEEREIVRLAASQVRSAQPCSGFNPRIRPLGAAPSAQSTAAEEVLVARRLSGACIALNPAFDR